MAADRLIVVIDDRPGSAAGETTIAVSPASPWYELLPDFQVAEIFTREDGST